MINLSWIEQKNCLYDEKHGVIYFRKGNVCGHLKFAYFADENKITCSWIGLQWFN